MPPADLAAAFCRDLAAACADLGLRHVCISPGSRNSPLTLGMAAEPRLRRWSHHDERSAAFFALGLARITETPVALVCTSGTAGAHYHPAIIEAHHTRVPLLVLTADRPPELRDVGAPQTIDQIGLYGGAVRWFYQGAPPDEAAVRRAPTLAAHAWAESSGPPPGPVHLNLPFREPLLPAGSDAPHHQRLPTPEVHLAATSPSAESVARLASLAGGRRTLLVAGAQPSGAAEALDRLSVHLGAPVLADPQSGLRAGARHGTIVTTADLLAGAGMLERLPPEVVFRWGGLPTSKPVWRWLEDHPAVPQVLVDEAGWRDPIGSATVVVRADPAATAQALLGAEPAPGEWTDAWRRAERTAAAALDAALAAEPFPNEPAVARQVVAAAPPGSVLYVGSSMPIRDVDTFAALRPAPLRILADRGANGIDGLLSAALGAAAAGTPVVALAGDVAAVHDLGALATAARLGLPVTIVVVHNDGGGIFHFLPQADPNRIDPAVFEAHFGTPHGIDFVAVAVSLGIPAARVTTAAELAASIAPGSGPRLVEVRTDRRENVAVHRRLRDAVAAALRGGRVLH